MAPLSILDIYGESLRIYFGFIEQLTWLSFALSLLSLAMVYINFTGGYYNGTNKNDKSDPARGSQELLGTINLVTISNFKGYTNFTLDPQAINWVEEMKPSYQNYMFVDLIVTISLLTWIFYFKVYSGVLAAQLGQANLRASIYTVEVKGLPATQNEGAPK